MGTRNAPSKYDCFANAEPDEPMFILLARDPVAPLLVKRWAELRHDVALDQLREAVECADAMETWRLEHRPLKKAPNDFELEVARERIVGAAMRWAAAANRGALAGELFDAVEAFEKACKP